MAKKEHREQPWQNLKDVRGTINTIARGFVGGGNLSSTRKKHLHYINSQIEKLKSSSLTREARQMSFIGFGS